MILISLLIRTLVEEVQADGDFRVTEFIGDMVERHYVKGLISVNGKFGCEVCEAPAITEGRGSKWPYPQTAGHPYRTMQGMREISR